MQLVRMFDLTKRFKVGDEVMLRIFATLGIAPAFTNESNGKVRRVHRFYDSATIEARLPEIEALLAAHREQVTARRREIARHAGQVAGARLRESTDVVARIDRLERMLGAICTTLQVNVD